MKITLNAMTLLAMVMLAGCGCNPMAPSIPEPTPVITHQVVYMATSTASENIITYIDGNGQSHQVHAGGDWFLTLTAYPSATSGGSYFVYLACASVSTEMPMQQSTVTIFVDGQVVDKNTCRNDFTLAQAYKQFK